MSLVYVQYTNRIIKDYVLNFKYRTLFKIYVYELFLSHWTSLTNFFST